MAKMTVDDKLGIDRFYADEKNPHITIDPDYADGAKIDLLVSACPAGLYQYENGRIIFNHEGCLECGTCRVLSKGDVVRTWSYPMGGRGVEYVQG